jgi:acetoin utilization protein AcuB
MTTNNGPTVGDYMTKTPATVNAGLTLADALDRMYADNVRHLPVVDDGDKLVGLISTRDVAVAASIRGLDPKKITVGAAMSGTPFTCEADASLSEVVMAMEGDRLGSTVVTGDGKPVGMFTTTDALRAVRSLIAGRPVAPASEATHIVDHADDREATARRHPRASGSSSSSGTLSWFLSPL